MEEMMKLVVQQTEQREHEHYQRLKTALKAFTADKRQEQITKALAEIENDERREALLAKLKDLPTDELQRLVG